MRGSPESISGNPIRVSYSARQRIVSATSDKYSSSLIPYDEQHVIGKGRNHEVRASHSSSPKSNLQGSNIADEKNKDNFKCNCIACHMIVEALLRNRE